MPLKRRKVRRIAIVPTLLTLGNAICGFVAIIKIGDGAPEDCLVAAQLILLAMVFDALDGMMARLARVAGNFGGQLDSLSDVLSFGAAPAYLTVWVGTHASLPEELVYSLACFYLACTAVRLARFNVENSPEGAAHLSFAGLPSPAAAGVLATLTWVSVEPGIPALRFLQELRPVAPFLLLVLGVLMISRVRYDHVLNRFLRGIHPIVRLLEVLLAVLFLALLREYALCLGFLIYMLSGPVSFVKNRVLRAEAEPEMPVVEEDLF